MCTSFYCTSLYYALQVLCFLQPEGLWQTCEQVYFVHLSTAFAHFTPLCHILVISLLFYLLWRSATSDYNVLKAQVMVSNF